ncbi:MAG: ferredoxin [Acidimicrobiia bacterium]
MLLDDGLAYVREGAKIYAASEGNPEGSAGVAVVPTGQDDITVEAAEECPGECIFIEP